MQRRCRNHGQCSNRTQTSHFVPQTLQKYRQTNIELGFQYIAHVGDDLSHASNRTFLHFLVNLLRLQLLQCAIVQLANERTEFSTNL